MKRYASALLTAVVAAFVSVASVIMLLPFNGDASQNNQFLPTTGTFSGLTAANTINNAIDSLNTCNSGSVAPTNALGGAPKEGQCWLDTTSATAKILKRYTGSAWIVEGVLDVTNSRWQPPIGGGSGTVASAATTDLCASPQAVQTINGTTTITAFGSSCIVGIRKTLIFNGSITLTHNATSLVIPGGLSKSAVAGDVAEAVYLGSGNWRVVSFVPIGGTVVTSIAGNTGIFTLGVGITNSGNQIRLALTNASLQALPGAPANTGSTTGVMMGLGTTCTITPVYSGRIRVHFTGMLSNNTGGNTHGYNVRYGTGTAPANGVAATGTVLGSSMTVGPNSVANQLWPISSGGVITGLTTGVAVWLDMSYATSANTLAASNLACSADEF